MPPPRILVVDDQLAFAQTVADGLVDHGYQAEALSSGRAALARLAAEHFDALVTDLRMPDLDGLELASAARRQAPHLAVVVMTAYGAVGAGAEFLSKPFRSEELRLLLERALELTCPRVR